MRWAGILSLIYVLAGFGLILFPIFSVGLSSLDLAFFIEEPRYQGRSGGVASLIISTVCLNIIAVLTVALLAIPIAFRIETNADRKGITSSIVSTALDLLAATPSIVFGLFGHAFFGKALGLGYSLLSGALTLSLMILPQCIHLITSAVRLVDADYRTLSRSLGIGDATFSFRILLPLIWPSVLAALILSWGRAIGETAALLYTSGYSLRRPESLFDSGRTLSVHVFELSMNLSGTDDQAYRTVAVILILSLGFSGFCNILMEGMRWWQDRKLL